MPEDPPRDELMRLRYSVPEAADMLGISVATAWRRVKSGQIQTVRDGWRVLITYDELRRYATRGTELKAS